MASSAGHAFQFGNNVLYTTPRVAVIGKFCSNLACQLKGVKFLGCCVLPDKKLYGNCLIRAEYTALKFFTLPSKTEFSPKIFTVLKYFWSFRIFEQLALALKTEFAVKFFKTGGSADPRLVRLCAYQTWTATSSFAWSTRNNRHDWPNAGRSQRASSITTLQPACGLINGHIDIHGNSLEDPGVITSKSD